MLDLVAIFITQANRSSTAVRIARLMANVYGPTRVRRGIAARLERLIQKRFGCYIARQAQIAPDLTLPHPVGIVIGTGVQIGHGCTIFQNVTLGAARLGEGRLNLYPTLEDGVTVFAGAVIVGPVRIGAGATIGANSVVLHDVPAGAVAVGSPARILTQPLAEEG
ncbi:MAG: serine acetyltransferase [Hyphomonas sp.]|jgi:serine O-acetyltransferase|nr:serine acetyltransferase [Hyphomonas sp.]